MTGKTETNIDTKEEESVKKISIKQNRIITNTNAKNDYRSKKKKIDDSTEEILESPSDKNNKESKQEKKEKENKKENTIANVTNEEYINSIKNYKTKYIELDNNQEIEISKYPLLIGENISEEFYTDIYRYLFIEKHNLNIFRFPE